MHDKLRHRGAELATALDRFLCANQIERTHLHHTRTLSVCFTMFCPRPYLMIDVYPLEDAKGIGGCCNVSTLYIIPLSHKE